MIYEYEEFAGCFSKRYLKNIIETEFAEKKKRC